MNVVFDHSEEVAPNIKTFWFRPERPVHYIAGQFTELYLPHDNADDRGIRRWFTLSSSPSEELLGITTRFSLQSGSSFKQQLAALQPGTQLKLADPMGDFVLPKDPSIPLIFVAAGLGITPVRSIVTWLRDTGERRDIQLLYASRNGEELAFETLLKSYVMTFTPLSTNRPSDTGTTLTPERILGLAQTHKDALLYISGPEGMVETTIKSLRSAGIAEHRLIGDYFPGYLLL